MTKHPFNRQPSDRHWRFGRQASGFRLPISSCADPIPAAPAEGTESTIFEETAEDTADSTDEKKRTAPMAQLEAVLFIAREPLSGRRLSQMVELPDGIRVRPLLQQLNDDYDRRQCAFRVIEVAGGFQLRTRPEFAPWLLRLQEVPVTVRLSAPTMETLAVIAYRQPVLRAEIERIRGVQCGELIRQLMDRDLVKIAGRSEELGRPFFYGTTRNFLEVFGLGSLRDLPDYELFARPDTASDSANCDPDASTDRSSLGCDLSVAVESPNPPVSASPES